MLTQALGLKLSVSELGEKTYNDLLSAAYNQGLLQHYQTADQLEAERLAISQGGLDVDRVNAARQLWEAMNEDTRSSMLKEYDRAKEEGYTGSLEDWKILSGDPEMIKLYNASIEDGSFSGGLWDFISQRAKAGASSIKVTTGEKVQEKLELGYITARLDLYDPSKREEAINNAISRMNISEQIKLDMQGDSPEAKEIRKDVIGRAMHSLITTGRGEILKEGISKDGKSLVFAVEWTNPDGTTSQEILTHAIE